MLHEVLNSDIAIEVFIKSQECFPHFEALFRYFALNFHVKKLDSIRQDISLIFFGPIILSFHFTDVTVFIGLSFLVKYMQLWEENLSELVETHSIGWHSVFEGWNHRHIVKQVQRFKSHCNLTSAKLDPLHNWWSEDVLVYDVALSCEIEIVECLLWASIHVFEVESKRFFDFDGHVMFAESVLETWSVAVDFAALLIDRRAGATMLQSGSLLNCHWNRFVTLSVQSSTHGSSRLPPTSTPYLRVVLLILSIAVHCRLFDWCVWNDWASIVIVIELLSSMTTLACVQSICKFFPSILLEQLFPRDVCCAIKSKIFVDWVSLS